MKYRSYIIIDNYWNGWSAVVSKNNNFITLSSNTSEAKSFIDLDIDYFDSRQMIKADRKGK